LENNILLDSCTLKSEDLSLTFSFDLLWIPASAGMTRQPKGCHSRKNGNPDYKNFKYFCLDLIHTPEGFQSYFKSRLVKDLPLPNA